MLTDAERATIITICQELLARYSVAVDTGDIDLLLTAFAPDLHWERPGSAAMKTHADVRAFFTELHRRRNAETPHGHATRHMFTTMWIDVADADAATGITYAQVYRDGAYSGAPPSPLPPTPELIVEYRDRFARTGAGWKIVRHEAHHVFRADFYRNLPAGSTPPGQGRR